MTKQYCTYKEWERLINTTYENKLIWSEQLILFALKNNKSPSLSLSWGKDSIAMLYMVKKHCKKVKIIFANTGIEYPETYKYRDMMLKEQLKDIDYIETKPIKSFWQCVKEYGYPHYRMTSETDKKKRQPKCCIFLKERPLSQKQKELGVDLNFMGLMGTESMNRRRLFMRLGGYYYKKSEKINVCLPLAIWKDDDILKYIKDNNIIINPLYNQMSRTGCMFCSGFKNWEKVMAKYNKNIFKKYILKKSGQTLLPECNF